jgi:predicted PurR-regulated permease PerM
MNSSDAWSGPLRRAGLASWSALGIIALAVVVALGLSAVSGILVPLVVAVLLGIVLEPLAALLRRFRVPPTLSVVLALLVAVVVRGFLAQWPEIYRQLMAGWSSLLNWVRSLDLEADVLDRARVALEGHAAGLAEGVVGAVASTFYGALSLFMGIFFALFFLFFTLRDADRFPAWLSRTGGFDPAEVTEVVALSRESVRGYFRGTAITAVVTAPIFMVPLVLLGIPLAVPIFILYFFLSFIPFLGAWITGAFAVLIALGTGGPSAALIIGITFIISNGTIQSAVNSWALGSSLRLHPVAVLLATMIGGTVAGLLGMVIGAPVLAACVKSIAAIRALRAQNTS